MKKGDLKDIKLHGPAFAGSWWKDKAPKGCQGLGVDKALDGWKSDCLDVTTFNELEEVEKAESAADDLSKALGKARKPADSDTKDAIEKFEDIIKDYLKLVALVKGEMQADEKESSDLVSALKMVKNKEMFYGLVRKGRSGCLFVSRKSQVCSRLTRKAKTNNDEVKGGQTYVGKCDFASGRVRFHFEEKPPNLKAVLRQLLQPANMKPGIVVGGVDLDDALQQRFDQLQLNVKQVRDANAATEDTVKGWASVLKDAKSLIEQDDSDAADAKLDQIEPAILAALGVSRTAGTANETGSNVGKARTAVRDVRFAAIRSVGKLIEALRETKDPRAGWIADFLVGLAKEFPDALEQALDRLDKAIAKGEPETSLKPLKAAVAEASKQWLTFLQRNTGYVDGCENNPWKIPVQLRAGVTEAIKQALTNA